MTSTANVAPDWGHEYGIRELWSQILPGLYVGGTADDDVLGRAVAWEENSGRTVRPAAASATITANDFDAVVTAYSFARPVDWGVEELRWGFMDGTDPVDLETLRETVVWAHKRWAAGKQVLIRCQAGLNRSSLIAALVMIRSGMEPQAAIDKIRRTRSPRALFNTEFVRLIHQTPVEFWRE